MTMMLLTGRITGYAYADDPRCLSWRRALETFKPGDSLEFLFDYNDKEGKLIRIRRYSAGPLLVTKPDNLKA